MCATSFAMASEQILDNPQMAVPDQKTIHVYLVGTGLVGGALLDQVSKNHDMLFEKFGADVKIVAMANSRKMHFNREGIALNDWRSLLNSSQEPISLDLFLKHMHESNLPNTIFVDCTSNQAIADSYVKIFQSGIPIVTPSKKANSSSMDYYKRLRTASSESEAEFVYDSNVGAGLPILATLKGLLRSGDEVVKIEAILSGTLSYLFNSFKDGVLFSALVKDAQRKGYTEPDPRDDLNGKDVARKILILARECGSEIEMSDIQLQRFLPDACFDVATVEDFYAQLEKYDATFAKVQKDAENQNKKLRFIASYENGKASVSLQLIGPDHPFYNLSENDNIIAITTKYYSKNPLVIKGPGAGADVTAARVLEGVISVGIERN